MARNFKVLLDAGITVVRMWLMGDGANYDGIFEYGSGNNRGVFWDFHPPDTVHQSFLDDFSALLEICKLSKTEKMQLIPVLLDFGFFDEPPRDNEGRYPTKPGLTPTSGDYARGRRSIASNPLFRSTFIKGTLEPLLQIAAKEKEIIYAFEVMNEPWWCIASITGALFGKAVPKNDMTVFLSECCASIKKFGFQSTIGHRYLSNIYSDFSAVKVDRAQHHYYAHPRLYDGLMNAAQMRPKPATILGEFGSITQKEFDALVRQFDDITTFYRNCRSEEVYGRSNKKIRVAEVPSNRRMQKPSPPHSTASAACRHRMTGSNAARICCAQ
jgi:hypothetical protein